LAVSRTERLRIGVIGLGRLWEARHKPALARLRDRFQVVSVYDQVERRAAIEAATLRCSVAEGLTAMIESRGIDAIYLLTPQWYGLHPVELAAKAGKPVYSALPPAGDAEGLDRVAGAVRSAGSFYMPELARRFYPATTRLRELLRTNLGRPRMIQGYTRLFGFDRYGAPGPSTQLSPVPLSIDPGSYLLDWCRFIFDDVPKRVRGVEARVVPPPPEDSSGPDYLHVTLGFGDDRIAQMGIGRLHRERWGDATRFLPPPGFQVFAENGTAWLEMPDRIQWTDAHGVHDERLPMEPAVGELLNQHFFRMVRGEIDASPSIEDALEIVRLDRQLQASLRDAQSGT
jgi:predicted dehydrogenase